VSSGCNIANFFFPLPLGELAALPQIPLLDVKVHFATRKGGKREGKDRKERDGRTPHPI